MCCLTKAGFSLILIAISVDLSRAFKMIQSDLEIGPW